MTNTDRFFLAVLTGAALLLTWHIHTEVHALLDSVRGAEHHISNQIHEGVGCKTWRVDR